MIKARIGGSDVVSSIHRLHDKDVTFLLRLAAVAGAEISVENWERMREKMREWKRGSINPLKVAATVLDMTKECEEVCYIAECAARAL